MFKLTSQKLVKQLQDKAASLAGRRPAAAITIPSDMSWVLAQEYGTIGPYTIEARNGDHLRLPATLAHPSASFPESVIHPGLQPKAFIREALPEIQELVSLRVINALKNSKYNPDAVQQAIEDSIMPDVKEVLAEAIDHALTQKRTADDPGKLGVEAPGAVFREQAEITNTSEKE